MVDEVVTPTARETGSISPPDPALFTRVPIPPEPMAGVPLDTPSTFSPFGPSPGIGTSAASPISGGVPDEKVDTLKAAADKEMADIKVLTDMEHGIRDKLLALSDTLGGEYHAMFKTYSDMSDDLKAHPLYKSLGDRIATVEAALNTLVHTAASFPVDTVLPVAAVPTIDTLNTRLTALEAAAHLQIPVPPVPHGSL